MSPSIRRILFLLFFLSGFCGLVYQVVWTRMAFASFGIITPVLSVVLSVFMLGLSVGSWAAGKYIAALKRKTGISAVVFYALAELLIGFGAFAVPELFAGGERLLLVSGQTDSVRYLLLSAVVLGVSILPWCLFMGSTFPLMMAYIRERDAEHPDSFSYLYLANVLGAMSGTLLSAVVFIEWFGFQDTLRVACAANIVIASISLWLGRRDRSAAPVPVNPAAPLKSAVALPPQSVRGWTVKGILFSTGFVAMAMEVVWTRAFTPVLTTQVYSFAVIVFAYLGATFAGSWLYRRNLRSGRVRSIAALIAMLTLASFLPVLINDARLIHGIRGGGIHLPSAMVLVASICPLCAVLGYLTPSLIDGYAAGDPAEAGKAYAINVLGCILGPLFASYVLLPFVSEKNALLLLSAPCVLCYLFLFKSVPRWWRPASAMLVAAAAAVCLFVSEDLETQLLRTDKNTEVRRDHAASVISFGEGRKKYLLVNGIGMTTLTPITKYMVHLPLAFHRERPQSALIICFGMGTTFRSSLSWDIDTTAVELVPGVKDAFEFYHRDAADYLHNPKGRIVIDDGRRYLKRTREKFDVIVIDPPPPVEAAGSSLLYSQEFYALAKQHLKPHGIVQAWFPGGEPSIAQAALRSIADSFPHVCGFGSVEGWGIHLFGSMEPIELPTIDELISRLPEKAKKDLLEWSSTGDLSVDFDKVLSRNLSLTKSLNPDPLVRITDDQPYNEYFLMRRWGL